jgi:hypothetical protein
VPGGGSAVAPGPPALLLLVGGIPLTDITALVDLPQLLGIDLAGRAAGRPP